jgi:hypothetical protein
MDRCKLSASCFFYNELVTDMPHSTEYLRSRYCDGNYVECMRFILSKKHGMDKVPTYIYPNDKLAIRS